jgi:hypothetical protein
VARVTAPVALPAQTRGVAAPGEVVLDEDRGATARGDGAAPTPGAQRATAEARPAPQPPIAGLLLGCGVLAGWGR